MFIYDELERARQCRKKSKTKEQNGNEREEQFTTVNDDLHSFQSASENGVIEYRSFDGKVMEKGMFCFHLEKKDISVSSNKH